MIDKDVEIVIRKVGNGYLVKPHNVTIGDMELLVFQKLDGYSTEQTLIEFIKKHFE